MYKPKVAAAAASAVDILSLVCDYIAFMHICLFLTCTGSTTVLYFFSAQYINGVLPSPNKQNILGSEMLF